MHRPQLRDSALERTQGLRVLFGSICRGLAERGQRLLQGGHPRLRRGNASLHLLLPLFERLQACGGRLAGAVQLVLPLPRALERVGEVAHLADERVGVRAERLEAARRVEQARQIPLQGQRRVEAGAQLLDVPPQMLQLFRGVVHLCFGAPLGAGDGFRLLIERREHRHEPLQRLDATLQLGHDLLCFGDRLGKLAQLLGGFARSGGQRLERHALALHLGENGAKLGGELRGARPMPEKLPAHVGPREGTWRLAASAER